MEDRGPAPVTQPRPLRPALLLRSGLPGQLLMAVFGLWMVLAVAIPVHDSQDAIPMVVAGELVRQDPSAVYNPDASDLYDLNPTFRERSCEVYGPSGNCEARAVAFLSPPTALPPVAVIGLLPDPVAVKVFNLVAAMAAAAAFTVLWLRLSHRGERARWLVSATALIATLPLVAAVELGQTSPLMYLSAVLGLAWSDRPRLRVLAGVVLAICVAFKAWPALLLVLAVVERRWRWAATTVILVGAGTAVAVLMGGFDLLGDFLRSTASVGRQSPSNPYNGGIETVLHRSLGLADGGWAVGVGSMAVRAVIVAVAARAVWRSPSDVRWVTAWAVLVVVSPLTWNHYAPVGLMGIGVVVAVTEGDERWLWSMPVWGLAALAIEYLDPVGSWVPLLRFALVAATLVVIVLAARTDSASGGGGRPAARPVAVG